MIPRWAIVAILILTSAGAWAQLKPTEPYHEDLKVAYKSGESPMDICPAMYQQYLARNRKFHPPRGFVQVDTEFGPMTALKDKRTGLLWLHLDLTSQMSYIQVRWAITKGELAGWRFATPLELQQLFAHFNGARNGFLKDDVLATRLQHELGGPLFFTSNPENGFCRNSSIGLLDVRFDLGHAQYGYIANDNFFGPSMDPKLQGSAQDVSATGSIGSWLVREDHRGNRFWNALRRIFR